MQGGEDGGWLMESKYCAAQMAVIRQFLKSPLYLWVKSAFFYNQLRYFV
jgi:hypothetical protein